MTITIYGSDYDEIRQEANLSYQNLESEHFSETLHLVPDRLGQGYIQQIRLNGIILSLFNYQLHEDLFIISKGQDESQSYREFGFHLSGNRSEKRTGQNFIEWDNFGKPNGEVFITYAKDPILKVDIHLEYADGLSQSVAEILEELPAETKEHICNNGNLSEIDRITPAMQSALRQIFFCSFQGKMKQIYLESKSMELITLKLEQLQQRGKLTRILYSLKPDDIDRIHLAKDILTANFDNPPTLTELAQKVGLNDCTLKRGFREVFGTTAFGYLHNYRLEQARQLLLERRLNITEIARKVGFASRTSLSKGFRKKYGVSPKQYQTRF